LVKGAPLAVYAAMFCAAVGIGAWELIVTRLASVLYFLDLAHLAVAVAVLALGIGALVARRWLQVSRPELAIGGLLGLMVVAVGLASWALRVSDAAWGIGLFALPFALFGAASAIAYRSLSKHGPQRLYAVEAAGFLVGMLAVGPALLPLLPAPVLGDVGIRTHLRSLVQRHGLAEHHAATDAYARTDFVRTRQPGVAYIFTDGMFVTRMVAWDGKTATFADPAVERLATLKRLSYRIAPHQRVLLLGAGAGFDAAVALQEGAKQVDAVEVNGTTIAFARRRDAWAGNVLASARVNTHVAEARRFVSQTEARYDQVNLTLMQTSPASGRSRSPIHARTLTVEAISRYFELLTPGGVVVVVQNTGIYTDRTQAGLIEALRRRGLDPSRHLRRVQAPDVGTKDNPFSHLLIASLAPLTSQQDAKLARFVDAHPSFKVANDRAKSALSGPLATDDRPFLFTGDIPLHVPFAGGLAFVALVGLMRRGSKRGGVAFVRRAVGVAAAGAGSMLVQVVIVYRAQAAIGLPTWAMATSLSALMGGAAIGALLIPRLTKLTTRAAGFAAAASSAAMCLALGPLTDSFVTLPISTAAVAFGVSIAVIALPLGQPFIAAMRQAGGDDTLDEGFVIGADGIGGVLGAAAATGVAMTAGFGVAGWLAALAFVAFAWLVPT